MPDITESEHIAGVYVVEPTIHGDQRGSVHRDLPPRVGSRVHVEMIQSNRANRQQGALVGLHYHLHQSDYWYIPFGEARVVLHDLREGGAHRRRKPLPRPVGREPHGRRTSRRAWPTGSPHSPTW